LSFKIKSSKIKLSLCFSTTNGELVLLTIESKWLKAIVHTTKVAYFKLFCSKQVQFFISIHICDKFWLLALFAPISFKIFNNLSHKLKPLCMVRLCLLLWQLFLMIMSNIMWNTTVTLMSWSEFLNKKIS
jgi:hypothetical protein